MSPSWLSVGWHFDVAVALPLALGATFYHLGRYARRSRRTEEPERRPYDHDGRV